MATIGFIVPGSFLNPDPCTAAVGPVPGTFIICDRGIDAPDGPQFELDYTVNAGGYYDALFVPGNCVGVKLLPECAVVDGGIGTEGLVDSLCYEDVGRIDWEEAEACPAFGSVADA